MGLGDSKFIPEAKEEQELGQFGSILDNVSLMHAHLHVKDWDIMTYSSKMFKTCLLDVASS